MKIASSQSFGKMEAGLEIDLLWIDVRLCPDQGNRVFVWESGQLSVFVGLNEVESCL